MASADKPVLGKLKERAPAVATLSMRAPVLGKLKERAPAVGVVTPRV